MKVPTPKKLPSGMWRVQLQLGGERISITRPSKRECETEAQLIKAEYLAGKHLPEAPPRSAPCLAEAVSAYIDTRRSTRSPSTIVGYLNISRNCFQSVMHTPIDKINWQTAVDAETRIHSAKTIRNAFGLMKAACRAQGIAITADLPAKVKPDKQWLTTEQIKVFLDAVKGTKCEIPALLALHSLRKSEVCGLEWANLDLSSDPPVIHVSGAKVIDEHGNWIRKAQNKTYESARTVPIFIPQLVDALNGVEEKNGPVIKVHPETPYRQIQTICREHDLPLVGWHGLRHSFASLCFSLGISELDCMHLGGWSDYHTMRQIYTHISQEHKEETASKLTSFFQNAHENAHAAQKTG